MSFIYKENSISLENLEIFYKSMDCIFFPALSTQVIIPEYVVKLYQNAKLFEVWHNDNLAGLIACYANDTENKNAFITSVIIHPDFQKNKLATTLLKNCLSYLSEHHFNRVQLEVYQDNMPALKLYKKAGFIEISQNGQMIKMEKNL
ncbi:MAG: GNAT family N-acetyltransferase [Alphaproteobacteria bacterium]|nr:GNAT family N-acetyltransferase [Alphaproteobacteria bacterium]